MSKLFFKLLNKSQAEILEILKNFSRHGVLAGGTALMVQIAHRKSYDVEGYKKEILYFEGQ